MVFRWRHVKCCNVHHKDAVIAAMRSFARVSVAGFSFGNPPMFILCSCFLT